MNVELERIGWKNLPSEDTPVSAENLKQMENNTENAINKAVERNEIVVYQTGAQIASQNATCKLQASKQVGEKFTLNNNEVVIGKGVNKVSVSAQIYFEYINSEQKYFSIRIMKNGALVAERLTEYKGNSFCCPTASFPIVDVKEGDKITLNFGDINDKQPTTRQGMTNTFLAVKAII